MTDSSKKILESVAQRTARLKVRLAETQAAIRRGRENAGASAEAAPTEDGEDERGEDRPSNVLPFVRR